MVLDTLLKCSSCANKKKEGKEERKNRPTLIVAIFRYFVLQYLIKLRNSMPKNKSVPPINNSLITNFFGKENERRTSVCLQKEKQINTINKFYRDCFSQTLFEEESCIRVSCITDKKTLKDKISHFKSELNRIQQATQVAMEICNEKDKEINLLQSKSVNFETIGAVSICHNTNNSPNALLFQDFAHLFTEEQIRNFRSIDMTLPADSTFILHVTRSIYEKKLDELQQTTIKGKGKQSSKNEMDADILKTITNMFVERIDSLQISQPEKENRKKRLNTLLNRAISNINKSVSKNKVLI